MKDHAGVKNSPEEEEDEKKEDGNCYVGGSDISGGDIF